ncbi:MAG: 50S ribosomal protein L21 [Candidatus Omnitrophica bacterium]|nr:50S ribosomal protein L21 [Candidatus Omnitrophota bacterium]MDE2008549.1 50S ribosomal protein L21 [Candidatus Omnitrophota bacterium]MDE2214015.1 50S ribosomal protein L21 [Candidatus Omnitrophota bacterium]MDE2231007.1 50S ribosomal protein L21 [Candidatus Omnitrophota bacterium]
MFAVVQVGNSQFKVSEGDCIQANRLDFEKGQSIVLDKVLLYSDGKDVKLGRPYLKDVQVQAEIVGQTRAPKVVAFKYRKRKDSARTHGHRQDLTTVKIAKISV